MANPATLYAFTFDPETQRESPVRILSACRFRSGDRTLSGELRFPYWVLDCPISYCGHTRPGASSVWRRRSPGRAHLYAPGTGWVEDNRDAGMHESCYIIFDGGIQLGLEPLIGASGFAAIYDPELELARRITAIAACGIRRGNRGILAAIAELYHFFDYLLEYAQPQEDGWKLTRESHSERTLSRRVRDYLERHYQETLTLREIAGALKLSRSTLTHRYHAETGDSVMNALAACRLAQSLPLLRRRLPLKQIAAAVGLADEFQYSRLFKRHYGLAPKHWREQNSK